MNYDAIQTLGKERSLAYMNTLGIVECNRRGKKEERKKERERESQQADRV